MSEEILKVLEKLKNKSNYQRDCNDGSYFIELFANEIYILCKFMEDLQQKVEQLMLEIDRLNNIINRIDSFVERTIEVIKQQPTGDDEWIKRTSSEGSDKYLVSCDGKVYKITDLFFKGKFNSADIYANLKEGKKYKITTTGYRIGFFSEYQNINDYKLIEE